YAGRPEISGLPHARVNGDNTVETLEVTLHDPATEIEYVLDYTVFPEQDCIVRSMLIRNTSQNRAVIERAMSFCLDINNMEYALIQTHGSYGRERFGFSRTPLHTGVQTIFSSRNSSGHDHNPAFALASKDATEDRGEVFGGMLVYSANFSIEIEADPFFRTRVVGGIGSDFSWTLEPGETFRTPEAILTRSSEGLGGMSRNFHDMIRDHLIRPYWAHRERPILINNWEGTYMNFDRKKLLAIADSAAECNLEMFVLDDGWFGHRDDDRSSLGDWFVYEKKVGSLKTLAEEINRKGLVFGLWFEPEMISEDSELYKLHPDWVFTAPGRDKTYGRNQLVLNMGIPAVVDYLYSMIAKILHSAPIAYMKWDFNRQPAEISNPLLPPDRQKEAAHRFMLGTYELHRRLLEEFPELLIEGCSGGGGRFDAGILYYTPQIWTSDNTDAIDRLFIQSCTSLFYPCSAQGAHVSVCPNHGTGRTTPLETRGLVALAGTFGYELDMTKMTDGEKETVRQQCAMYHQYHHLVSDGDQYRLADPWDCRCCQWEFAAKDGSEAIVIDVVFRQIIHPGTRFMRLRGLNPDAMYRETGTDRIFSGAFLMNAGITIKPDGRDYVANLIHFKSI
ncbi:MAG: alpha-galactosidase, partial [Lentisphaeria bacterium]|nr:alpha-galactosidase [Lentisphaeria bacterium]